MKTLRRLAVVLIVLVILASGSTWADWKGNNGTVGSPIILTASTDEATYTVPSGGTTTALLLANDGSVNIYIAFEDRAVNTSTDFFLKANESFLLPISLKKFRYKTASSTAVLRGVAVR